MSGAVNAIEKIKTGLSDHPQVRAVLKRQNEEIDEAKRAPKMKGDSIAIQRAKDAEHAKAMGRSVKTGRKLPGKRMTSTQKSLASLRAGYGESVNEAKKPDYTIYHKSFSPAVQHALSQVEKQGFSIDEEEWGRKVAMGPRKPGKG